MDTSVLPSELDPEFTQISFSEINNFVFGQWNRNSKTGKYVQYLKYLRSMLGSEKLFKGVTISARISFRIFLIKNFASYVDFYQQHLKVLGQLTYFLCLVCDSEDTKKLLQKYFAEYENKEKWILQEDLMRTNPEEIWAQIEQIITDTKDFDLVKFVEKCHSQMETFLHNPDGSERISDDDDFKYEISSDYANIIEKYQIRFELEEQQKINQRMTIDYGETECWERRITFQRHQSEQQTILEKKQKDDLLGIHK